MESREKSITDLILSFSLNFSLMLLKLVVENGYRAAKELSPSDELLNCILDGL